ncbi:unnamed protein product [Rodentolepis nana]|uniref:G_PROTEIN_RECEP_F3_4 domain-containing protein n=1 Tax=Rodentolepis nana TaxID=102285 RepID=A0A158QIG5_RODNA|nr:unnamed protein product [Rodentolepis nana]
MGLFPCRWIAFFFFTISELQLVSYGVLYKQLKVRIPGDIMIGALFPIHEQPTVVTAFSRQCGSIREQYGIHRIEVLIRTIQEINENENILPGIKIGVDARDSCWYGPVALERCMDFIRNAFLYKEYSDCMKMKNGSNEKCLPKGVDSSNIETPIAALIGPGSSEMTKQVHQVLQIFQIPQIGYSATAADLSNRAEYKYFLRVVPSDNLQVEVIASILQKYGWTYVTLLSSIGIYGERGTALLKIRMNAAGICSETEHSIDNKETDEAFLKLADDIFNPQRKAKVVICFCQGETVGGLLKAMDTLNLHGMGYTLIGTDGWSDRLDILGPVINQTTGEQAYSRIARGSFSIKIHSPEVKDFNEYFTSLTPQTHHSINPWFTEFWEQKFNCRINSTAHDKRRQCTGQESMKDFPFHQDNKLSLLRLAIYVLTLALHQVQEIVCGVGRPGVCPGLLPVNGTLLWQELLKVTYTDRNNDKISFDENGDPPANYDLMNYQFTVDEDGKSVYKYVEIGKWKEGRLETIDLDHIQFHNEFENASGPVNSYCSAPCGPWEAKIVKSKSKACCWICQPCKANEWKTPNELCEPCELGFKPNINKTGCEPIIPYYTHWTDPTCLTGITFACVGGILTFIILIIFIIHRDTAVVKVSTRELMWIILLAMLLAHASVSTILLRPSVTTCALQRSLPALAFTAIYGALVTKTNRIARILEGSKRILLKKKRFLSTSAQLVITGYYYKNATVNSDYHVAFFTGSHQLLEHISAHTDTLKCVVEKTELEFHFRHTTVTGFLFKEICCYLFKVQVFDFSSVACATYFLFGSSSMSFASVDRCHRITRVYFPNRFLHDMKHTSLKRCM